MNREERETAFTHHREESKYSIWITDKTSQWNY